MKTHLHRRNTISKHYAIIRRYIHKTSDNSVILQPNDTVTFSAFKNIKFLAVKQKQKTFRNPQFLNGSIRQTNNQKIVFFVLKPREIKYDNEIATSVFCVSHNVKSSCCNVKLHSQFLETNDVLTGLICQIASYFYLNPISGRLKQSYCIRKWPVFKTFFIDGQYSVTDMQSARLLG